MLIALALAVALAPAQTGAPAPPANPTAAEQRPPDRRADLQRFSARMEQRLTAACRPAEPVVFMSTLPGTRFVYLDGVGAVFLLPPRALPAPLTNETGSVPELSVSAARHAAPESPQVRVVQRPSDLADLEARIRETRKEAERMRAQADAAFADAERQLMAELRPGLSEATLNTSFPVPWTLFLEDSVDDARSPEQVEKDVKDSLVTSLLEDSSLLRTLNPGDLVTASVDLISRPQPWVRGKPARTITVRAKKSDLDAFVGGRLTKEELLKRVETKAY